MSVVGDVTVVRGGGTARVGFLLTLESEKISCGKRNPDDGVRN